MKMNISVKKFYGSCYLKIIAENVNIEEDLSEGIFEKDENGKLNFSKRIMTDITDGSMSEIISAVEDMVYYREREYNSENLINLLFDKLPNDIREKVLKQLNKEYGNNDE
jgi:hypothetical protein